MTLKILFVIAIFLAPIAIINSTKNKDNGDDDVGAIIVFIVFIAIFIVVIINDVPHFLSRKHLNLILIGTWLVYFSYILILIMIIRMKINSFFSSQERKTSQKISNIQGKYSSKKNTLLEAISEKERSIKYIEMNNLKAQNNIESLRPIVSRVDSFDDDFLEQYPKILQWVNESIKESEV